jgi:hypothetical protein
LGIGEDEYKDDVHLPKELSVCSVIAGLCLCSCDSFALEGFVDIMLLIVLQEASGLLLMSCLHPVMVLVRCFGNNLYLLLSVCFFFLYFIAGCNS